MKGLREMLLQEEARLEKILKKVETELCAAPEGSLHLSSSNNQVQYYHHFPGQEKRGEYLSKKETAFIRQLAQKGYDEKLRRLLCCRLRQIKSITKDYEDEEIEQIFNGEHRERQKLIRPVEPTWNQRLASWKAEEYIGKSFPEGAPAIYTEQGERIRILHSCRAERGRNFTGSITGAWMTCNMRRRQYKKSTVTKKTIFSRVKN